MNFVPKITFEDHQIPETSVTAFLNNKIYFFCEKSIKFYDLTTKKIEFFKKIENVTNLFVVKGVLCALYANKLTVFKDKEEIYKLEDIPRKLIKNGNKTESIGFLYDNSVEIFNLYKLSTVFFQNLKITDIFTENEFSYFTVNNFVYKTKNIFITFQITCPEKIYTGFGFIESIFVNKSLFLMIENRIQKISKTEDSFSLDFSGKNSGFFSFLNNYFLGEKLVYFGTAPFLILNENIKNMFQSESDENFYIVLTRSRIFYIEEVLDVVSKKCVPEKENVEFMNDIKWFSETITINENDIKVPEEFMAFRSNYVDLEVGLLKYEKLFAQIKEMDSRVEKREHELLFLHKKLKDDIQTLEKKQKSLQQRIENLTKLGKEVSAGDTRFFYELISKLNVLLKENVCLNVDYKKIFKIQKAVLKSKLGSGKNLQSI